MKHRAEKSTLIISSMHRSGSSLTASILRSLGLHIGQRLIEKTEYNTKEYLENLDFYEFHKQVLQSQGLNEDGWTLQEKIDIGENFKEKAKEIIAKNSISGNWGWKEPRTTLFLDFWSHLLPNAKFILIYRSPWEVVDSLYTQQDEIFQAQPELAVTLWLHYNQKIIDFYNYAANRCLLINIQTIISNQEVFIDQINQKFKTNFNYPVVNFYDPSLFNNRVSTESHRPTIIDYYFPEAIEMYQELEARAWNPEDEIPNFSWQEKIKSSPYRVWAFQDWIDLSGLKKQNKFLLEELEKYKIKLKDQESELQKSQATQKEFLQIKSKLHETQGELVQYQSQLHETQEELEQSICKLQEIESVGQKSQSQLEKLQYQQAILRDSKLEIKTEYKLLVWEAWYAYQNDNLAGMQQDLQRSLKYTESSRTEVVMDWLDSFTNFFQAKGQDFDSEKLTSSEEWQKLIKRTMRIKQKFLVSNEK